MQDALTADHGSEKMTDSQISQQRPRKLQWFIGDARHRETGGLEFGQALAHPGIKPAVNADVAGVGRL